MADNQSSLNENLIAAGLNPNSPATTYVDFADAISRNRREQASQEQALELAKQHVAQAKIQTKQSTEADAAGANPLLVDTMTPEEAEKYLQIVMKAKGLDIDQASITEWVNTLPPRVNRQIVESFANRFARESTRSGQPTMFEKTDKIAVPQGVTAESLGLVEDEKNPAFGHVPENGMYQVVYDNQGTIKKFIPGGKEAPDPTAKLTAKASETAAKQWEKLDKEINTAFKTRSGGLGSISTAIFRAVRAINTITSTENITAQDLANISQDIAGIFQGGAPTVVTARDNDYSTIFTEFADTFRKYTGHLAKFRDSGVLNDTKDKMLQVLVDLRDSSISNIKAYIESEEPAFKEIIDSDPTRWKEMQDKKISFIESGLLIPAGANTKLNITGMEHSQETKKPGEAPKPAAAKAKTVPKYTVEK